MLLDICLGTKTSWRILFVLNEAPGKGVSRNEIKKIKKLGNKVLSKFLLILEKFEVILKIKVGRAYYYKLNFNNPFVLNIIEIIKTEKKELNNLDVDTANVIREFVYELTNLDLENISQIILFGSYAKRTYSERSDIDLALILKKKNLNNELLITEVLDKINKRFGVEIQPHYYTQVEFDKLKGKDRLVKEILKDGIRLV